MISNVLRDSYALQISMKYPVHKGIVRQNDDQPWLYHCHCLNTTTAGLGLYNSRTVAYRTKVQTRNSY